MDLIASIILDNLNFLRVFKEEYTKEKYSQIMED